MKYRYIGNSGLAVSRICLGTMTFGNETWGCDQAGSTALVDMFLDAGGNFLDTADIYSAGVSETMLGRAIKDKDRDELIIASKCWFPTADTPTARGLSRKHIVESCEASLRRMEVDYIDLYQVHGPDPYTPIEETMAALGDLVRDGKIRYAGCSNLYAWQIVKANAAARDIGAEPFISGQYLYNLIRRDIEREIVPACVDQGMGILPWSPLASGLLTGKHRGKDAPDPGSRFEAMGSILNPRFWWEEALELVDLVCRQADELGTSPAAVSLAWLLGDAAVSSVIVGARDTAQLEGSLEAGDWDLPDEEAEQLTNRLPCPHGYPCDWMQTALLGTFNKTESGPGRAQRFPPVQFR